MRYLILIVVVAACSIIPDDALDYIPSSCRIKSFTIQKSDESRPVSATLAHHGGFDQPTKIEITWPSGNTLMRVPIFDQSRTITKTIYELDNYRVTKITNINDQDKTARVETFTYAGPKKIKQHTQTNFHDGVEVNVFTNTFFYDADAVDSVHQQLCFDDGTCWTGFFVALEGRSGEVSLYSDCASGAYLQRDANYFGIMPYTQGVPYSFSEQVSSYWDDETQSFIYSVNDFEKSHYSMSSGDGPVLFSFSKMNVHTNDILSTEYNCESIFFDAEFNGETYGYYNDGFFLGYRRAAALTLTNSYDRYFSPLYYYALQYPMVNGYSQGGNVLVPQAAFLAALTRKADYLYYSRDNSFDLDGESRYEINYVFEISNE